MSNSAKWLITIAIAAACVLAIAHGLRDPRVDDVWVDDTRKPATSMWYEARIAELEERVRKCESEAHEYYMRPLNASDDEHPVRGRDRPSPERKEGGDGK